MGVSKECVWEYHALPLGGVPQGQWRVLLCIQGLLTRCFGGPADDLEA